MKTYLIRRRRDAYRDYLIEVHATSATDALNIAEKNCDKLTWRDGGVQEFEYEEFEVLTDDDSVDVD